MRKPADLHLGTLAVESKLLTQEQLTQALDELKASSDSSLALVFLSKGMLTSQQLNYLRSLTWTEQGQEITGTEGAWIPAPEGTFGKYDLHRSVGKGGSSVVYESEDPQLKRRVALKVFRPSPMGDPDREAAKYERFLRESRLVANLPKHPNIVSVYEAGFQGGLKYLAMEYVEGQLLNEWWADRSIGRERVLRVLALVASAIHHAHEHGVVHRDLKPQNIIIDSAGKPMITDFGLAKSLEEDAGPTVTDAHLAMGTPAYMSPEQAQSSKTVDRRTDVYALGVILYEILTGDTPFTGESSVDVLIKVVSEQVVPPSRKTRVEGAAQLSKNLDQVCLRALAKSPGDRYPTAQAFADDLLRALENRPVQSARRPSQAAWVALATAALLIGATVFALSAGSPAKPPPPSGDLPAPPPQGARQWKEGDLQDLIQEFGALRGADPLFLRHAEAARYLEIAREIAGDDRESVAKLEAAYREEFGALVAGHWPLDGPAAGRIARDASAHGVHGKLLEGPEWTDEGLSFDGINDHVEIPPAPHLDRLQEGAYTLSAWYKPFVIPSVPPPTEDQDAIVMKPGQHEGLTYTSRGHFYMTHWLKDEAPAVATTWDNYFTPGRWRHLAGSVDPKSGELKIYVDGVLVNKLDFPENAPPREYGNLPWRIGIGNPTGTAYRWAARGIIRNVRMYSRSLDDEEILSVFRFEKSSFGSAPPGGDLRAHWPLDGTSDHGDEIDASPYHHHALRVAAAASTPEEGLRLDGKDGLLRVPNSPWLDRVTRGDYTVSAWFKPEADGDAAARSDDAYASIMTFAGASEGLAYTGDHRLAMMHHLESLEWAGARSEDTFYYPGRYHHVAGVVNHEKGRTRLYVDGTIAGEALFEAGSKGADYGFRSWRIGMAAPYEEDPDRRGALRGWLDDIRIFARALPPEEIKVLHSEGRR